MVTDATYFTKAAEQMRKVKIPETPIKHEWIELVTLLSQVDTPQLREIGLSELARHKKQEADFKAASDNNKIRD